MKKYILFGLILLIFPLFGVNATSISSIDMDIYVKDDGNAIITETWNVNVTDGTEGYHPYYNLGNSTISNLVVSMDGEEFTTISDWDIDDSFGDKSYKAGFYQASSNELDICFGVSSYGNHTYIIQYMISGFVAEVNDYDMIYWNLFPYDFSAKPDNVSITIYSDFNYYDVELYGYGKYGAYNELRNGKIYIDSKGTVDTDEYITILARFSKDTFNSSNVLDNDFEYYYNMAEEGAINYSDNSNSFVSKLLAFLGAFLSIFINIFVWGFIVIFVLLSNRNGKCRFGNVGNKVRKDVPNFREIPCNKDIYRAYWVAYNYGLINKKEDLLGAILLKWLKDGNIKIDKIEKSGLLKNKTESNVLFLKEPTSGIELEIKLYSWMLEASGEDGKLESNEFKKWCKKNYSKIIKFFDEIIDFESKMLVNEGKAKITQENKFKFFKFSYYDIDGSMMQEAEQMTGLKKFLKEFTLIKEREPIEVSLWNEYLIYAQIFGIADKVASQFKKLYPEVIDSMNSMGYDYSDILFIHMITYDGMKSANAAQSAAHSSAGGGGGSFGGGGGGGGFR